MKTKEKVMLAIKAQIAVAQEIKSDFITLTVAEGKKILSLLEPEARVLTLEEVRKLPPETLLWQEFKNQTRVVPVEMIAVRKSNEFEDSFFAKPPEEIISFGDGCDSTEDYGNYYRLWTAKPTEDQRREARWP